MRILTLLLGLLYMTFSCQSQSPSSNIQEDIVVGGPCEGCEALFEYGQRTLASIDTLPAFEENEPKIKVSGTIFQADGKTPAPEIIMYIYQTNRAGIYEKKASDTTYWGQRHGYIRSWLQTDEQGRYTFYTFRPGSYPNRQIPEHIHITVKERGKTPYYLEDFQFDDDPLLTAENRANLSNRGGSGVLELVYKEGILSAQRDIILGSNIDDYR
jgi:protocatechuate 3,4-dioxygenase beta subunit